MEGEKHNVANNDGFKEFIPPPLITDDRIQGTKFNCSKAAHHIKEVRAELMDTYIMMCMHGRRGMELGKEFARIKENISLLNCTLSNTINSLEKKNQYSKYLTINRGKSNEFITPREVNGQEDMVELFDAEIQRIGVEISENCCRMKEIVIESENIDALLITLIGRAMELNGKLANHQNDLALLSLYLNWAVRLNPRRFEDKDKQVSINDVEHEGFKSLEKTNDINGMFEVLKEEFAKLQSKLTIQCEHAKRCRELEKEVARNMTNLTAVKHALSKVQNACAQAVVGDSCSAINSFYTSPSQSKYFNINKINENKECIALKETDNLEDTIKVFDGEITRLCLELSEKCNRQEEIFTELKSLERDLGPPLHLVMDVLGLLDFCIVSFDKLRAT